MILNQHLNNRIRIAQVISSFATGGGENLLFAMAKYWNHREFDYQLFVLIKKKLRYENLRNLKITYKIIDMKSELDFFAIWRYIYQLRHFKPHIIHTHLIGADLLSHYLKRFLYKPIVVTTLHSVPEHYVGSCKHKGIRQILYDWLLTHSHKTVFVACSQGIFQKFNDRFRNLKKLHCIPNGIDARLYADYPIKEGVEVRQKLEIDNDDFLILTVSRIEVQKNVFNLIEAASKVLNQFHNIKFIWAGDGSLRKNAEQMVIQKGLENRIKFIGNRSDIPALLKAADLFVLPSDYEGLPLSILEAMAAGVPIVSTSVGSIPQVLHMGNDYESDLGWLVPPKDSRALATEILGVVRNNTERQTKSIAAQKEVLKNYDVKQTTKKYEDIYRNFLREGNNPY